MRPTGDGHRRALFPSAKPRDAEAMDVGVARELDDKLGKHRAEAGNKPKQRPVEPESCDRQRRRG